MRIACQELEAWYFGEPDALAEAFGDETLRRIGAKARYRDPDAIERPSAALEQLVPDLPESLRRTANGTPSLPGKEQVAELPGADRGDPSSGCAHSRTCDVNRSEPADGDEN